MKSIILPLIAISIVSIAVTEAADKKKKSVYKCPTKVEGRYSYQSKPCPNSEDDPEKNKLKIISVNKEKVKAAREKLKKELKAQQAKKDEANGIVK